MKKAFIQRLRYGVLALMVAGVCSSPLSVHADDFDDDLYYSPAKAEKQKKKEEEARRAAALKAQKDYEARLARYDSITAAYDAAHPMQGLDMNEDSYNRHGSFLVGESRGDSTLLGGMPVGDFAYTRRIERFHNDSIVSQSSDEELQDYYYATAAQQADPTIVNIYVNNPYAYGGYPYYGYPTYWGDYWGCYGRPYGWNWNWGWSMGWNIGWHDPWFDFGWGPSWGWSWGWGWGPWYPGPGYPGGWSRPWQTTGIPGASHPHRPSYAGASGHGGAGYRPGQATTSSIGTVRPGNMGRGRYSSGTNSGITTSSSRRPGNMMPSSVNGGSNTGVRPGNSGRGREPGAPSPASRNRGSYSSSYNTGSSSSGSSGSYSSGSRGSSSFGGGSYGGGGRSGGGASGGRGRR